MKKHVSTEDIIEEIYNLIVNQETTDEERQILVDFKSRLGNDKQDLSDSLADLQRAIQTLAVKNLSQEKSLSPAVSQLSQRLTSFQEKVERDVNIARGLTSLGMFR